MRLQVCKLPLQCNAVGGQPNCAQPRQGMQLLCEWDDVWPERGLSACEADLIDTSLHKQPGLQRSEESFDGCPRPVQPSSMQYA